ncbi:MAG: bifunctional IscS subfamily cysteine desulfurase/selenide, water dikinase SelD, partial [Bacteroidetes bacterium HGW-Bacteroidetes-22]
MSIYLDYNATTPIDPEVADAMRPYLESVFGNPSSSHAFGVKARMAVETARGQVGVLLGCDADEVVFTSGGSESNNMAIKGVAYNLQHRGKHIITTSIEHPAVTEVCSFLEKQGFEITSVGVDPYGIVNVAEIEQAIRPDTILISVMHANNETGSIQPIEEIGRLARERGILLHCDAAQSVGKIPVRVRSMQVDLLSVAGHKLYAPKGIGVLYIRRGVTLEKLIHGADHERNLRAGTENVLEIVGLGKACEIAGRDLNKNMKYMKQLRDRLNEGIAASVEEVKLNGHPDWRLPNTLSLSFRNVEANTLLSELTNMAASAGAACHSGEVEMSRVLSAMKLPEEWAMGTVRFSTGRFLSDTEVDQAVEMVSGAVGRLRAGKQEPES